jgi:hypothetical protein
VTPIASMTCAALVTGAFVLAGFGQTLFLRSALSARFSAPLDRGLTLRGRRIFGDNKTLRGIVVLVPAVTLCFAGLGALAASGVFGRGLWPLDTVGWVRLGLASAMGYALGELPNSFVKRQLDVPPGEAPRHPLGRRVAFIVDQLDSIIVALIIIAVMVPTDWIFWVACLVAGAILHWLFNVLLYTLGIKTRAA